MTDKKLTDEEIIKSLKFCEDCFASINIGIIDLINRQKLEIERLQKEVNLVSIRFQDIQERQEESQAEIDKLNAENILTISERNAFRTSFYDVLKQLKTAKTEAYKEFAERLCEDRVSNDPVVIATKCLLKEMVGENNV